MLAVICAVSPLAVSSQDAKRLSRALAVQAIDSPARAGSAEPNLHAAPDGRLFLSWIEQAGDRRHALRFAVRKAGRWSAPATIAEGDNWFVNWADFPSIIALADGTIAAHWLVKSAKDTYAYDVHVARSTDGGKSWSKPLVPHRDGTHTEHGFVSLLPWTSGGVAAAWLDGRKFKTSEGDHHGHGSSTNEMTLRFTVIGARGQLSDEPLLDDRVCECCQTSAALTSEGAVVAYRDRSKEEIRDISVVRFHKGRWSEPATVHADGWRIEGCPVNGPSVAALGRRVAVAWFTAANDTARVNLAFSSDAAASFNKPVQIDDGSPLGRVDVEMLSDGSAIVCWLERTATGAEIRARRVWADGSRGEAVIVAASSAARASGFPRMARLGNEVFFAWTQSDKPSVVRMASLRLK
jgi:hypothetical protein